MTSLVRSLRCTSCATEASISFSSDLEINELVISAECPKCGNSMQFNYQLVSSKSDQPQTALSGSQTSLFTPTSSIEEVFGTSEEIPSDTLKDLMED